MPFILTPEEILAEGLVLDGLDLGQGPNGSIQLDSFTPPIPRKRHEWIEAADSDGAILPRDPLVSNGQAVIKLAIVAGDRDGAQNLVGQIVDKLEEADRNPGGIPLVWTPSGSSDTLTFNVLSGEVTEFPVDWESGYMAYQPSLTITLDCEPYGELPEYTVTGSATAGPLVSLDLTDVPGDAPAKAILRITESSSQSRRTVEFGAEYLHHNPASPTTLVLDSDSLVTSGFAGTQTTLTGAYDPGGAGNSIIVSTVATSPQAICGTGAQPHIGPFRVKLRMNSGPGGCTDVSIQFAWRAGDGDYRRNDPIVVTSTTNNEFLERDLGLITIPEAAAGTQTWDGRVEASRPSDSDTIYVDYLMLIPVEAGYGKAVASYSYSPGVIVARDDFNGIAATTALGGLTADVGGTWATSGAATDLVAYDGPLSGQESFTRSATSGDRLAILGSTVYANTEARLWVRKPGPGLGTYKSALVLRYVDAINYLIVGISQVGSLSTLSAIKVVAGVSTTITSASLPVTDTDWTITALVYASGRAIGTATNSAGLIYATIDASDAVLATGGALDDGKAGFIDSGTAAAARYYDDFFVSTPAAEPIALYSGRKLEIRHDSAERESSAGGTWGRPQSYRGSRFFVNPAGDQDRTTRVAVKCSRNDLATAADDNLTDQILLTAVITPRCSVVPRA